MRIFFRKNDLEKSLENTEKQLSSIERAVGSLENIGSDPGKSEEFDHCLESLQSTANKFVQLIAETRIILTFYLGRPDRATRLLDYEDHKRTADLLMQLTWSYESLRPLSKNLEDNVAKARTAKSAGDRIKYVDVLRVSVSGLKETLAGWAHILREVMKLSTDRPDLRLLKGLINAILYAIITGVVLILASRSLVNLSQWFQMSVIFIVAIGIFLSCLMGKPPKIVIIDLA